jgi:hypothetical protein
VLLRLVIAVLLAASMRLAVVSAAAFVIAYLLPFYVGYRVGTRKGYSGFQWLWRVTLFGWLGVLLLALRAPKGWTTVETPSEYHVPPGIDARRQGVEDSPLYGQRR